MRILGIDPGVDGAVALWDSGTITRFIDMPTTTHGTSREIDGRALWEHLSWLQHMQPVDCCFLEETHAMPKTGSQGNYSQGMSKGTIVTALRIATIPIQRVAPATWKLKSGLRGKEKVASLYLARELFPNRASDLKRAKDHNRAEAMLIARYGSFALSTEAVS